ncbi:Sua5/YciO/YrdC/YwlC family protein [Sessilibacter sp. MAH1]
MNQWLLNSKVIQATQALNRGEVIAYPTEAVWGLGCDPFDEQAVFKILHLKQRPYKKGVILVAANIEQLLPFLKGLSNEHLHTLEQSWPGPNTWVIPHNGTAPPWVRGVHQSLAVRVSDHPVVQALCTRFGGPIVSTSANPGGLPAAKTQLQVRKYFPAEPLYYAPGQVGNLQSPTQIRDLLSGAVLRCA